MNLAGDIQGTQGVSVLNVCHIQMEHSRNKQRGFFSVLFGITMF